MTVPPPPPPAPSGGPPPAPPVPALGADGTASCFKHGGRITRIACSRCGRPICPDCMHDAPVGFHCPVCVKEGRAVRPRTLVGARLTPQAGVVSYALVVANVLVFLLYGDGTAHNGSLALIPYRVRFDHEYYRLLTAGFVHFSFLHILFNMLALVYIGPQLEAVLGRLRFSALYLVSLAGASALSYLLLPTTAIGGGASGAIFGVMGAMFIVFRRLNMDTRQLTGWIVYSLIFSFLPGLGIDWRGHIGGLVTGAAVTWGLVHAPKRHRGWIQAGALLLGLAVAIAVIAIRTATFPTQASLHFGG